MLIVRIVYNSIENYDKSHDRLLLEFDNLFQIEKSYTKVHLISISKLLNDNVFSNDIRLELKQFARLR